MLQNQETTRVSVDFGGVKGCKRNLRRMFRSASESVVYHDEDRDTHRLLVVGIEDGVNGLVSRLGGYLRPVKFTRCST